MKFTRNPFIICVLVIICLVSLITGQIEKCVPFSTQQSALFTFDDGPHPFFTDRVLDTLKQNNLKAIFFVLGTEAFHWPRLIQRILEEGHIIGIHSYKHQDLTTIDSLEDLRQTALNVYDASGPYKYWPILVRPPYGSFTDAQVAQWQLMGYDTILWDADPKDFDPDLTNEAKKQLLLSEMFVNNGSIILQHDIHDYSSALTPDFISLLKANYTPPSPKFTGLSFTTPMQCLNLNPSIIASRQNTFIQNNIPYGYFARPYEMGMAKEGVFTVPVKGSFKISMRYRCPVECAILMSLAHTQKSIGWLGDSGFTILKPGEGTVELTITTQWGLSKLNNKGFLIESKDYLNSLYKLEGFIVAKGDEKRPEAWQYSKTTFVYPYTVTGPEKKSGAISLRRTSVALLLCIFVLNILIFPIF